MTDKYSSYRQTNDDLLWSPSSNASNNYSLSSLGFDSPPEYSSSLPPINILGRETDFHNSRSLPSSIPMNELSINPSHITVSPSSFDFGLGLIDDNGMTMTSPTFAQNISQNISQNDDDNSYDDNDADDDYYDDEFVEGDFDDDDDWNVNTTNIRSKRKHNRSSSNGRAPSPAPAIDIDIAKRSRGRRVPTSDNQRVFKCPDPRCQKVFVRNEHLKRHIKSLHRDEKPFECLDPGCTKKFTRLDNVNCLSDCLCRCTNTFEFTTEIQRRQLRLEEDHRFQHRTIANSSIISNTVNIPPLSYDLHFSFLLISAFFDVNSLVL
ncbi:hypothetical protein E3Q06_02026 [Wallemia mellicola]|uniref:C2H2-type domain-containing protein n=1 Tax=Wallemia mellicola TaxID=1708541 RepID=A0A4T0SCQ4_9BASI|nr:hypothetical protein E3Q24_02004 [Wallemia mellicola]TIB85234.1 hypothetical protein E3Q21_02037 [Wallemia mellicola]TIB88459.1 hypothetical protein E3Q20_02030 [Wallemia mellicola]TIC40490.1 hypothetical protein E3Q07_02105 [Wallemia mellicola]TIC49016.1 hypothetical protein E3Q06_02026 [Wallemia mellicola]